MTPEAYLYQVLAPAVIAAVRMWFAVMAAVVGLGVLVGVLAIAWQSRGFIAKRVRETGEHYHAHAGGRLTTVH